MKTLSQTYFLDTDLGPIYRPLLIRLVLITVVTVVAAAASLIYFDTRMVRELSSQLIEKSVSLTENAVEQTFDRTARLLRLALGQIDARQLDDETVRMRIFGQLLPFFATYPLLDSINLSDDKGSELVLIRSGEEILTRHRLSNDLGNAFWRRYRDHRVVESWTRQMEGSPLDRPWYQGAIKAEAGNVYWTEPYRFLTTKEPGVSVSLRQLGQGPGLVMALNISLLDLSSVTRQLNPSPRGMGLVFNESMQVLGLPGNPAYEERDNLLAAVLSPLDSLGMPVIVDALAEWKRRGQSDGAFSFNASDGEHWWTGFQLNDRGVNQRLWKLVLIPAEDIFAGLEGQRNQLLGAILILGLLAGILVFVVSMTRIRRSLRQTMSQIERRLGQFQLKYKLGEGGNGTVYYAKHALLRRPTAIKLMNAAFARSPTARNRFEHEVQITSSLTHPNTVAIYDYGETPEGTLYYAMEYLNGITLEHLVRKHGPQPAGRVLMILRQVCGSLAEAHGHGLIHRDIKPSNIILCERGGVADWVKVLDFGLVKEINLADAPEQGADTLVGTPLYMAPEAIREPDHPLPQSDLYSLAVVGYYLLTGRHPFEGTSAAEICAQHLHDPPPPPSGRLNAPFSEDIEALLLACLAKAPEQRPANARQLREQLSACVDFGHWNWQDAETWWQNHYPATEGDDLQANIPLNNTEVLLGLDTSLTPTRGR